ncbi:MAG TPA: carboxypeptidase regulatory-like domain-containing protein, partial [Thermoanaerobaculia bacterium]|nr:carboxypeptidase regulatory-like domain-containing protein [Thermoanaerobaculia bacterium]
MKRTLAVLALLCCAVPLSAAVSGTVMTGEGQPIAGARVSLYAIESGEARRARLLSASPEAVPIATTQADAKGSFSLPSPKDTLVDLRVTARGYEPWQRRIERDEEAGAIVLPKAETASGTITANGKPVANALVVLMYGSPEYLARTDAAGRYEAPDPKRARSIAVIHPDYALLEDAAMTMRGGVTLDRTLTAGTPVNGRVLGSGGQPVAKATVSIDNWPLATSGDDGTFTIARAPAKWTTISAETGNLIGSRTATKERPVNIRVARAGTVNGRVLDAKTKLPVAGVSVRVAQRMMRSGDWSAVSDAKGNFSLNVLPGAYMLVATHPGYDVRPVDINVASGQSVTKELSLAPLARVSGVVVDDEKKPVVAASVGAQDVSAGMNFLQMRFRESSTVSGPDGRFSLRVRGDADLKLRALKKGLPPAMSEELELGPGERRNNLMLSIPSGIAVTGKATDRDGNALSGVAVTTQPTPTGPRAGMQRIIMGGPPANEDDAVRTGSDGTFTLRVAEGTYDFIFRREGFSTKAVRAKSVTHSGPNMVEATLEPAVEVSGRVVRNGTGVEGVSIFSFGEGESSDAITGPDGSFVLSNLTPGTVRVSLRKEDDLISEQRALTAPGRDVLIELPVGGRVSGRVIEKSTRKPLTSFQVGVSQSRSGGGMVMMAPPLLRSITSDDGTFTLENVPLGAVNFVAQAPGYSNVRLNLNVEEGKPISDLEVELDTGVKLAGKVTGPDGAALSDARVRIAAIANNSTVVRGMGKSTSTGTNGEYELDALEPGEETVEITHPKYLPVRKTVQLKGREVKLDVQLSAGQRVSGTVVTESGAPVSDAEVEAMASGGTMRRTRSDASGRFEFDSLSPARYQFSASKSGLAEGNVRDFDVSSGQPLRIVMKSGATLYGFVRGLNEQEISSAAVEARSPEGTTSATVDASGAYRLEGVPAGTVRVSAVVSSRSFTGRKSSPAQTVEVSPGGSHQLDLEFRSDVVIRGRVTRNGRPLPGASVSFSPKARAQTSGSVTADDQGTYSISGLEEGEYTVSVTDMQRYTSYTTTYELRGSDTFDIEHSANNLRGRVVDVGSGDPLADARVQLRLSSTNASMFRDTRVAATDSAGVFNFDLVPPGNYVITADKDGYGNFVLDLVVGDRTTDNVELKLARNDGVTLKVVDGRDGRAINAFVVVFDMQGRLVHDQRSFFGNDAASDVRLPLAPGSYRATIGSMGYGTRSVSFTSPSSQTVPLVPGGKIVVRSKHSTRERVRLIDASGTPYPRFSPILPAVTMN